MHDFPLPSRRIYALWVHALELAVLGLEFPIASQLGHTQTTEPRFPFVITG